MGWQLFFFFFNGNNQFDQRSRKLHILIYHHNGQFGNMYQELEIHLYPLSLVIPYFGNRNKKVIKDMNIDLNIWFFNIFICNH